MLVDDTRRDDDQPDEFLRRALVVDGQQVRRGVVDQTRAGSRRGI
ncbi:hypothetical protein [Haloarcula litorea]|nr:hypothetical protein [Halomicroarcula sp. GDY20]